MPELQTQKNPAFTIAVIGDDSFTMGFRLAGVRKIILTEKEDHEAKIEEALADKETGVLVVNQLDMESVPQRLQDKMRNSSRPVVVPVSKDESSVGMLRALVKKAIGVDVWEKQ